jgi:hypothetical protein
MCELLHTWSNMRALLSLCSFLLGQAAHHREGARMFGCMRSPTYVILRGGPISRRADEAASGKASGQCRPENGGRIFVVGGVDV